MNKESIGKVRISNSSSYSRENSLNGSFYNTLKPLDNLSVAWSSISRGSSGANFISKILLTSWSSSMWGWWVEGEFSTLILDPCPLFPSSIFQIIKQPALLFIIDWNTIIPFVINFRWHKCSKNKLYINYNLLLCMWEVFSFGIVSNVISI